MYASDDDLMTMVGRIDRMTRPAGRKNLELRVCHGKAQIWHIPEIGESDVDRVVLLEGADER